MKKVHISILIVTIVLTIAGTAFAASLAIKCPSVIAIKSLKTFALSKDKYVCFKSTADAKKSGYKNESSVKKSWKTVTSFNGSVDKATDPFSVTASQWRMKWTHPNNDNFAIVVYDATKNEYKKPMVNTIGTTNDSSNYYGSGSFYLL